MIAVGRRKGPPLVHHETQQTYHAEDPEQEDAKRFLCRSPFTCKPPWYVLVASMLYDCNDFVLLPKRRNEGDDLNSKHAVEITIERKFHIDDIRTINGISKVVVTIRVPNEGMTYYGLKIGASAASAEARE